MVGNKSNFSSYDIIRCLVFLSMSVSRQKLVSELGLGEGTVRSILDILKKKGLIASTRKGHSLTAKGASALRGISSKIELRKIKTDIYKGTKQSAVLVRTSKKADINVGLRDIAIRNNADAALILSFDSKLKAPGIEINFPELEGLFEFRKNNVLVVAFAKNQRDADNSALSVADKMIGIKI